MWKKEKVKIKVVIANLQIHVHILLKNEKKSSIKNGYVSSGEESDP